jgi:hypothetical protein
MMATVDLELAMEKDRDYLLLGDLEGLLLALEKGIELPWDFDPGSQQQRAVSA